MHKKQELQSGLDAHKALAQTATKHMQSLIELSHQHFQHVKRLRRWMVFSPSPKVRRISKALWYYLIRRVRFVIVIDYQMVCIKGCSLFSKY